jgi:very-short-patch-repair endonuclease
VAKLVSLREVCAFVRAHGAGDRVAGWVAEQQLGLIIPRQLYAAGINKDMITSRRRAGVLHRVHNHVYLFGSRIMVPGAQELAAILACGPGTVISHRSAAALWGLARSLSDEVEVTVVGRRSRSRQRLRVHRVDRLDARDRRLRCGIPVTSPARTLLDYAATAQPADLERAIAEASALRLVTEREIYRTLERTPRRFGAARLRAELDRERGPAWTQSDAERRMLRLIRSAGLPPPQTQVRIAGFPADFLWPEHKLIVEVDGYPFHSHRRAFERDRRRDAAHVAAGYLVIRFSWRQLKEEPLVVVATIGRALGRGSSRAAH